MMASASCSCRAQGARSGARRTPVGLPSRRSITTRTTVLQEGIGAIRDAQERLLRIERSIAELPRIAA